jgi:hypothetical protein
MTDKTTMLSVYSGRTCVGFILQRGKREYEAFAADDKSLGVFSTAPEAASVVSEKARP